MAVDFENVKQLAEEKKAKMIDLKYVDLIGRWKHVTIPIEALNEELFSKGVGFDGSSTAGFKRVEKSDTNIIPDPSTVFFDPFWEEPTISMICDIVDAATAEPFPLDPRRIAKQAEIYLQNTGIADQSLWGPEHEFNIFDGVKFGENNRSTFFSVLEDESTIGYTHPPGTGYHLPLPADKYRDLRNRICLLLKEAGVPIKYHHSENGWPGQNEIETNFEPLVQAADHVMLIRYMIRNVAAQHNKAVTFMPKPMLGECGNGMHVHQKLYKDGKPLFFDPQNYAQLSEIALYYIGGILKHAPALTGLVCASTNSFRRLVPGFEAPISLAFGLSNRTAAIRIPAYANTPETKRFEFRTPDATCNIYLALAAQLMAGLDGIQNKIDPTKEGFGPFDVNVYELPPEEQKKIGQLPHTLEDALDALANDYQFLTKGGVFTEEVIHNWINYKKKTEVIPMSLRPHPYEYMLYYDL